MSRFWDRNSRNCGKKASSPSEASEMLQKIATLRSFLARRRTIWEQRNRSRLSIVDIRPSGSATLRYSAGISTRPVASRRREKLS